jgi:hypothetical protein
MTLLHAENKFYSREVHTEALRLVEGRVDIE